MPKEDWPYIHALIQPGDVDRGASDVALNFMRRADPNNHNSNKFHHFRIRILEVEWFNDKDWSALSVKMGKEIMDDENFKIRYIELI